MRAFVVIHRGNLDLEKDFTLLGFRELRCSKNFSVWGNEQEGYSHKIADYLFEKNFLRIFESCFVVKLGESELRTEAVQLLFTELAGETYTAGIDMHRNIQCYEALYEGARNLASQDFVRALDFGCGPGTVLASNLYHKIEELVVYDIVQENRDYSTSLGLNALQPFEIENLNACAFDFIVCSYVLHYQSVEPKVLNSLLDKLKPGGVFAANFHKSVGVDWFLNCLETSHKLQLVKSHSAFGELIFLVKDGSDEKN